MTSKISILSVQLDWLDSKCLRQISKYTKARYELDNVEMNLRNSDILDQVIEHARQTNDPELRAIYGDLKHEIKTCLSNKSLSSNVQSLCVPDYLIAESEGLKVPRREIVKRWFSLGKNQALS